MIVAETPSLILRHLTLDDVDELAAIYADPAVMKFLGGCRTRKDTQRQVEQIIGNYEKWGLGLWATIYKADNQLIGRCGLIAQQVDGQEEIEIGYTLAKPYWGRGLATEAACASRDYGFGKLDCKRLISLIAPENIASQKVARKAGLSYEKETVFRTVNAHVYAIHQRGY